METNDVVGEIPIESGAFQIADLEVSPGLDEMDVYSLVNYMKEGRAVYLSTGGDGRFGVKLRLVEDINEKPEDIEDEWYISELTNEYVIKVESGQVSLSDLGGPYEKGEEVSMGVAPGNYQVKVIFYTETEDLTGFIGFLVLIGKTEKMADNEKLWEVEQLG